MTPTSPSLQSCSLAAIASQNRWNLPENRDRLSKWDETSTTRISWLALSSTDGLNCQQAQLIDLVTQSLHFRFEMHDSSNPLDADAFGREFSDPAQAGNIGIAVSTIAPLRASWLQQTASLVDTQCLRVHSRSLGSNGNHVQRTFVGSLAHRTPFDNFARGFEDVTRASSSTTLRSSSVRAAGTNTSTVTIRSPFALVVSIPRPLTR